MVTDGLRLVACLALLVATLGPAAGGPVAADVPDTDLISGDASLSATDLASGDAPAADLVSATDRSGHSAALANVQAAPETDNTITRIVVHENGSATWTLQIRTRLETDAEVEEYRAFQDRFRGNTSRYLDGFRESITGVVDGARGVTGREMAASDFRASTSVQSVPRRWGIVTYEFRWSRFAAADGDRLVVGDVFEGGLFIAGGDSLEVVAPPGYRVESAEPAPDEVEDGTVTWLGREDFADRRPQVVLVPAGTEARGSLPWPTIAAGGALLAIVAISASGYRRWRRGRGGEIGSGAVAGSAASGGESPLADEDFVRRVLVENGGRMRQKAIADELDWSRSKTSRVLGRMEEDGTIRKLQLGRENVIDLDGEADSRTG